MLNNFRRNLKWVMGTLVLGLSLGPALVAQTSEASRKVLTLEGAVDFALKNYPAVCASLERVTAAQAGVGLAKTNYLPRADTVWQTNRATDNNITGLLLPQSIIGPISRLPRMRQVLRNEFPQGQCTCTNFAHLQGDR